MGVNLYQPLELRLDPDFSRQGVVNASLVGRRTVSGVGLEGKPQVAVGSAVVGVEEGVRHGRNEPLQTLLVSLLFLPHPCLLGGIPQQVIKALGFFLLCRLVEWLTL